MVAPTHIAEVFQDSANEYRYRVKALNGEVIATSEGYVTRWGAKRAVRKNHPSVGEIRVLQRGY